MAPLLAINCEKVLETSARVTVHFVTRGVICVYVQFVSLYYMCGKCSFLHTCDAKFCVHCALYVHFAVKCYIRIPTPGVFIWQQCLCFDFIHVLIVRPS